MDVRRSNPIEVMKDHEKRINALERAPAGSLIFVDDRVLAADVDHVTFDGFPASATVIEVEWDCWLASGSTVPALMYLTFNDNYPPDPFTYEWRWRLDGSVELDTNGDGDAGAGGAAFFLGTLGQPDTWGRIRFPDITREAPGESSGQRYIGEGVGVGRSGSDLPDVWQIAGFADLSDPITAITLLAGTDTDITPQQSFGAGSRFTLTAY